MIKVGDLVEHKNKYIWGTLRGIVLKVREREVKVQWFPADKGSVWIQDPVDSLLVVSGAVYNSG